MSSIIESSDESVFIFICAFVKGARLLQNAMVIVTPLLVLVRARAIH
jgi:hypothetical protein